MEKIGVRYMGKTEQGTEPNVIFLSGYLCSGKGTYCERNFKSYMKIGVSSIIKQIIGQATRKELQDTAHLDQQIVQRICQIIDGRFHPKNKYVIDGIRQVSIYKGITKYLREHNILYHRIWLEVPKQECQRRFELKSDGKENIDFEQAFQRDADLGLLDLEKNWKSTHCEVINNY